MKFEYLKWDQSLAQAIESFANLMSLFNFLLLQASGDVDKALEWMQYLQQRGLIGSDVDLDEFRERLEEEQVIERAEGGSYSLTARGEQGIRQESLKYVFRNLGKGGFGHLSLFEQ